MRSAAVPVVRTTARDRLQLRSLTRPTSVPQNYRFDLRILRGRGLISENKYTVSNLNCSNLHRSQQLPQSSFSICAADSFYDPGGLA